MKPKKKIDGHIFLNWDTKHPKWNWIRNYNNKVIQTDKWRKQKQNKPKKRGRRKTCKTTNKQLNPNRIHLRGIVEIKIHTTVVEYYKIKKIHTQRKGRGNTTTWKGTWTKRGKKEHKTTLFLSKVTEGVNFQARERVAN